MQKKGDCRGINSGNTSSAKSVKIPHQSASMASINFVVSCLPARDKRIFMEFWCTALSEEQRRAIIISMKIEQTPGTIALFHTILSGYKFIPNHTAISVYSVLMPYVQYIDRKAYLTVAFLPKLNGF